MTGKTIFCNSGFEAVEAALKTAMLATGKPGVIAFEGAYHGLGYGALNVTQRGHFRSPFRRQLREFGHFVPFPKGDKASCGAGGRAEIAAVRAVESRIQRLFRREKIGAVLVEPVQVRGGVNVPPPGFLPMLRRLCDEHGALLILDEIYTGFGRAGQWFACEHSGTVPDVICLGKALTGGFPMSACVGRADVMDAAWPPSSGEAIHTSTFLGHPVGCAMALAQIREIESRELVRRSAELGRVLLSRLSGIGQSGRASVPASPNCSGNLGKNQGSRGRSPSRTGCFGTAFEIGGYKVSVRGVGLLAGVEVRLPDGSPGAEAVLATVKALLRQGFIFLPEGEHANVISLTPPLTIAEAQLREAVGMLEAVLPQTLKARRDLPKASRRRSHDPCQNRDLGGRASSRALIASDVWARGDARPPRGAALQCGKECAD
jgi:4-aminobutyrate aminotransferase-like enzyme